MSDNTVQAEGLSDFFKSLGKISVKVGKKLAKNILKNPSQALDITANIATAVASISPKHLLSTLPEVFNFYHTGKIFIWENLFKFLYNKRTKKQIDYIRQHHFKNKIIDLEQRLEKKLNDVNSFNNHINNIKEMITYFKNKNNNTKKKFKKYRTLTTILELFNTIVIFATTSSAITLTFIGTVW